MAYKVKKRKRSPNYRAYKLSNKNRTKARDEIDEVLSKKKGRTWKNINNLVADAYARGKYGV
jgi:hypothetical protein